MELTQPDNFESALKRLEEIVKTLDSGTLALDAMIEIYAEGMMLSGFCKSKLTEAEGKIEILNPKTMERTPFVVPETTI